MERRNALRSKKLLAGLGVGLLCLLAGSLWLERTTLWKWYTVSRLLHAKEGDESIWVERVAELDEAVLPDLLDCLRQPDEPVCTRARAGLFALLHRWPTDAVRQAALAAGLAERFPTLSEPGQRVVLDLLEVLVQAAPPTPADSRLVSATTNLLLAAAGANSEVRARALSLTAASLLTRQAPPWRDACCTLVRHCLADPRPTTRLQALVVAAHPELELLDAVVPLLNDPAAEVRRSAMLAVGATPTAIHTDDLLHWLHDPDAEVRTLCEEALRSRGLREEHIKLGRLMTDPRPAVRLQVLVRLYQVQDLEPGIWLRHLSHDPAPAVRAAAVRAAAEQSGKSLADRLEQMAQNDPSPSVRQLAQHYLTSPKSVAVEGRPR